MYPSTTFEIIDKSQINTIDMPAEDTVDRPYLMQVFAAPKGPEEWQSGIMGKEFAKLYGSNPSFAKYGQPLLQATMLASEGARMVTKRVVDDMNATLANILIYAEIDRVVEQKINEVTGNPVYYDEYGVETEVQADANNASKVGFVSYFGTPDATGDDCVTVEYCKITYNAANYNFGSADARLKTLKKWKHQIDNDPTFPHTADIGVTGYQNTLDPGSPSNVSAFTAEAIYPLFLITDNGRGVSNKSFKIYADETSRRPVNYTRYVLEVYEGTERLEQMAFTLNPDQIENDVNISIENVIKTKSSQIRTVMFTDNIKDLMNQIASVSGLTYAQVASYDILVGGEGFVNGTPATAALDLYAKGVKNIKIENNGSFKFNGLVGITLEGGSNGDFGDSSVVGNPAYEYELRRAFTEDYDDCIYDLDNFPSYAIFDANYPIDTKQAIEELVNFRDDMFYFRDQGTSATTLAEIQAIDNSYALDPESQTLSRAIGIYFQWFDIIDPISKKQITVTETYNLGLRFVNHYLNGVSRPFCGIRYGVTLPEVIEGTLNFAPKITPSGNQKQVIDDLRLNFAGYYDGALVMETNYTAQRKNTELDFTCNVLALQNLIREIRRKCPKIRYAYFADNGVDSSNSLSKYIEDVQSVIDKCAPNFATITLTYEENNIYENNKIFYACIDVSNPDWIQSERFKITVLQNV